MDDQPNEDNKEVINEENVDEITLPAPPVPVQDLVDISDQEEQDPDEDQGTEIVTSIAREIMEQEKIHGLQQDSSGEFEKLNFGLTEVVYEWAQGKPFAQIMELTDVQEGIIVRCIQQLNETLRDVRDAAHIIGCPILKQKMEEASNAIKRDIVFAASLYT
nr:unnamed protein product [Timema bartmani]